MICVPGGKCECGGVFLETGNGYSGGLRCNECSRQEDARMCFVCGSRIDIEGAAACRCTTCGAALVGGDIPAVSEAAVLAMREVSRTIRSKYAGREDEFAAAMRAAIGVFAEAMVHEGAIPESEASKL